MQGNTSRQAAWVSLLLTIHSRLDSTVTRTRRRRDQEEEGSRGEEREGKGRVFQMANVLPVPILVLLSDSVRTLFLSPPRAR